jgi:hypothetical protein
MARLAEGSRELTGPFAVGDSVKVVRIDPEDATVAEHTACWLGAVGTVATAGLGGEYWIEFPTTCDRHKATGAVFTPDELERQPAV